MPEKQPGRPRIPTPNIKPERKIPGFVPTKSPSIPNKKVPEITPAPDRGAPEFQPKPSPDATPHKSPPEIPPHSDPYRNPK